RITTNILKRREATLRAIGVFGNQLIQPTTEAAFDGLPLQMRAAPATAGMLADNMVTSGAVAAAVVQQTVRKQFADTAFWSANVQPDASGMATIRFDLPDDLTTWKLRTWSIDQNAQVGSAETEFVTRKNLIVRMQAPRFFTERDEVMLSANVHNYLDEAKKVRVELELEGSQLVSTSSLTETIEVPADGEIRVDWMVNVVKAGDAVVRMKALTDVESDAVERTFPVLVHGMLKTESWTGSIARNRRSASIDVTVPAERRPEQTELVVRYSPTLAGAMVDALPYLIEGPHSTTDGTLYRFVPAAVVQRVLQRTGIDLNAVRNKRANLNAQQLGDPAERAKQWKRYKRNPVFSNDEMNAIVRENLNVVVEMQLSDGGWGWFSGWGERSTAHMTATIVHGLQIAKENDLAVPDGVIERGIAWLKRYEENQIQRLDNWATETKPRKQNASNLDALVFMVLTDAVSSNPKMRTYLYRDRTKLSVAANAMLGMALHKLGEGEPRQQLAMVLRNLSQFVEKDNENQTAWLKLPRAGWWYWWGNDIEAQAWYLKLLAKTDPKGQLAPAVARYLLNNRRHATWWSSIRDTALSVEALAEFTLASGEFEPDVQVEILVDGKVQKQLAINRDNLFSYDDRVTLSGDQLTSGRHTIEIRKSGTGPLYYSAYLTNFTKEDSIAATGLEIKVDRQFYKLTKQETQDTVAGSRGQAIKQRGQKYRRERLVNFAEVKSGDLIEVELLINSKNDYDNVVLEDPKAAGFEAVSQTSGYNGNGIGAYMEVRDNRIVLYARRLARGQQSVSYRLRAEVPGKFSAMPTKAFGMYAPELKANSDESKFVVRDQE
ncbi:MAG: alpha-2-macroglobulin family protein, partial [Planctomycetaceae bacterium]